MIWALVSTILGSLISISRKKSLDLTSLKGLKFMIFGFSGGFLIGLTFLFLGLIDLKILLNLTFLILFIIIVLIDIFGSKLEQGVYKREKVSTLMPFENLQKIFTVIAGYFLFGNTSIFTFIVTIITIFVIMGFSIDFKKFEMPKFLGLIVFTNSLRAIQTIFVTYLLKITDVKTFFALNDLVKLTLLALVMAFMFRKDMLVIFKQTKEFYFYRLFAGIFGGVNYLIILFLMKELGLVTTILLSFLGMVFKLIFGYFMLKEIPGKKDVILAFIVASLIGVGYYFG